MWFSNVSRMNKMLILIDQGLNREKPEKKLKTQSCFTSLIVNVDVSNTLVTMVITAALQGLRDFSIHSVEVDMDGILVSRSGEHAE